MTTGTLFNLTSATGLDLRHIPKALRDTRSYGLADTRSWAALFNDPDLARPPHQLVFGTPARFGEFYDVSPRQAQDILREGHHHHIANFYITVAGSEQHLRVAREARISSERAAAGRSSGESRRAKATDVSGGDVTGGLSGSATPEAKFQP
jgi:hypothetical protein